jgi:hypothetical protein
LSCVIEKFPISLSSLISPLSCLVFFTTILIPWQVPFGQFERN